LGNCAVREFEGVRLRIDEFNRPSKLFLNPEIAASR
jgi:hypothetical protein